MADETTPTSTEYQPSAEARLLAQTVLAAVSAAPADQQVPLFRYHLERLADSLEQLNLGFLDFLAECAMLAGQNIQDVRLQFVEIRLDKLENPEPPTFFEIAVDLAIVLAVEIAVVAMPYIGAGMVAGFLVASVKTRNMYSVWRWQNLEKRIGEIKESLKPLAGQLKNLDQELAKIAKNIPDTDPAKRVLLAKRSELTQTIRRMTSDHWRLKSRLETLNFCEDSQLDPVFTRPDPAIKSGKWSQFWKEATHTAHSRFGQDAGAALNKYVERYGINGESWWEASFPGYLTSDALGKFMTEISQERLDAADQYSVLRNTIRYQHDDFLLENKEIQDFLLSGMDALIEGKSSFSLRDVVRPAIIAGFELACWVSYMLRTGALEVEENVHAVVQRSREYDVVGDMLVFEAANPPTDAIAPPSQVVKGNRYPGINILSDLLADYLYRKFAREYLKSVLYGIVPFPYFEENYMDVLAMPATFWGGMISNHLRTQRIGELKILVIVAFRDFLQGLKGVETIPLLGGEPRKIGDLLPVAPTPPAPPASEAEMEAARQQSLDNLSDAVSQTDYAVVNAFLQERNLLESLMKGFSLLVFVYQREMASDTLDATEQLEFEQRFIVQRDEIVAMYYLFQTRFGEGDHAYLWEEIVRDFGDEIRLIENAQPEDLASDEVEWQLLDPYDDPVIP